MNNWEKNQNILDKLLVTGVELPQDLYGWLKNSCIEARENKISMRSRLAGHIKEEYRIPSDSITQEFKEFIADNSNKGNVYKSCMNLYSNLPSDYKLFISDLWVNYQKKYEFNPPHSHSGVASFVIFINIPYDLSEDEKGFHGDGVVKTSKFEFLSPSNNHRGGVALDTLDVDKSFEGKVMFFRSDQMHTVYPFYTTDDYRITVSGNLFYN